MLKGERWGLAREDWESGFSAMGLSLAIGVPGITYGAKWSCYVKEEGGKCRRRKYPAAKETR